MDQLRNAKAKLILDDLAKRFNLVTQEMTAQFTGGGEGYSITVRLAPGTVSPAYDSRVIDFYNDDKFGPRFIGRAGMRVPAFRVIAYVTRVAENPTEHPSALHAAVLGA